MKRSFLAACAAAVLITVASAPARAALNGYNLTDPGDNDSHFVTETGITSDGPGLPGRDSLHWTLQNNESGITYTNVALVINYVYGQIAGSSPMSMIYLGASQFDTTTLRPSSSGDVFAGLWFGVLSGGSYNGHAICTWAWSNVPGYGFDIVSPSVPALSPRAVPQPSSPFSPYPDQVMDPSKAYPVAPVAGALAPGSPLALPAGALQFVTLDTTDNSQANWIPWDQLSGDKDFHVLHDYVGQVVPEPSSLVALAGFAAAFTGLRRRR